MAHINLLPWRERLREERKKEFLTILIGVVIISAGILFLVHTYFTGEIDTQVARNEFVRTQVTVLDERVAEINQLRQQKEDIRARMNVISDLQGSRPIIVRIFEELVNTLPDGIYYETLSRTDNTISLEGVAESFAHVTELHRRLDGSDWFQATDLDDISVSPTGADTLANAIRFSLNLTLQLQLQQEEV